MSMFTRQQRRNLILDSLRAVDKLSPREVILADKIIELEDALLEVQDAYVELKNIVSHFLPSSAYSYCTEPKSLDDDLFVSLGSDSF